MSKAKKVFKPEDPVTDEMIDHEIAHDEKMPVIDPDEQFQEKSAIASGDDVAYEDKMYNVKIPFDLKVGKKRFQPGIHTVKRAMAEVLSEMVDKKRRADMAVHVGKSHLVERLLDRTLVVTEVPTIDFKNARR